MSKRRWSRSTHSSGKHSSRSTGAGGSSHTGFGSTDDQSVEDPLHLVDWLRVLYRRRWAALSVFAVVVAGAAIHVFTVTPQYEARVQLRIEASTPRVVDFDDLTGEDRAKIDYLETQYQILESRALARDSLDALELWDHPEFASVENDAEVTDSNDDVASDRSRSIDRFLGRLTITPRPRSGLVDVKFRSVDPALSASVANGFAEAYIKQNIGSRQGNFKEAFDLLARRLDEQREQLEESEAELQRYRENNDVLSLDGRQNTVYGKLTDLNVAVTRVKTDRIQKETLYNQLISLQANQAELETFPAILSNPFIQRVKSELSSLRAEQTQLSEELGERHPDMIKIRTAIQAAEAKLDEEIAKVVQSVRNEFLSAEAQERSLTAAVEAQQREALAQTGKAIEYEALQRVVDSDREIYQSLLRRMNETGISGELTTSSVRIIDQAEVPTVPVYPQKRLMLLIAMLLGSSLALSLVFFIEYMDQRINLPDQIKFSLGLKLLGVVPKVSLGRRGQGAVKRGRVGIFRRRKKGNHTDGPNGRDPIENPGSDYPLVNNGVPPAFAESIRGVRSNALFRSQQYQARSFAVTSAGPGEGKTMMASNFALALSAGRVGKSNRRPGERTRVLLMDSDMRAARIHELFGLDRSPGLAELISGTVKASEAVRASSVPGLWILPAGFPDDNPADLLGTTQFRETLKSLRRAFDWIVIDAPPVMPVIDACHIAQAGNSVVFVVRAGKTSLSTAQAALQQLAAANATFIGGILNDVNVHRHPYYYSPYYSHRYGKYYGHVGPTTSETVPSASDASRTGVGPDGSVDVPNLSLP